MKAKIENGTPIQTKGAHHNYRKEFEKTFKKLTSNHNAWQVWQDFVSLSALSIANAVDKRPEVWQKREDEYMNIFHRYCPPNVTKEIVNDEETDVTTYNKNDIESFRLFSELLGYTTMALDTNPNQDFLGQLYMDLDFGRGWKGQFFTPWEVAEMMARMQIDEDAIEKVIDGGYFSVADPCCGAGVMLLAFAQAIKFDYGVNYQQSILFVGQDIDPVVAKMAYIQMSLMGLPGYVAVGDSLANPVVGSDLLPNYDADKLWFTPMFYSTSWCFRRMACGDETVQYHPSRKSAKSNMEAVLFEDAAKNPTPKVNQTFKTSEKDISLAKKELSKLEQQKKSVKRFFNKGKEQLKREIKSKNRKKS